MTSKGEVISVFTSPNLSAGAPALGEAKGLKDESERYKKAIDDFEIKIYEEYSIEKIYEIYKLQFNQNSIIYEGKDVEKHYRFTESYKKIIDIDEINKNDFLEKVKDSIKQITGNHYIELISEDKGKIGNNLKIQDI